MQNLTHCSPPSANCRFEWFPAPEIGALLLALGALACLSLHLSDLPRSWQWWVLPALMGYAGHQSRRWRSRPRSHWEVDRQRRIIRCNGDELPSPRVSWRCGLLIIAWPEAGRLLCRSQVWLPWHLPGQAIRELRQWPARSHTDDPVAP